MALLNFLLSSYSIVSWQSGQHKSELQKQNPAVLSSAATGRVLTILKLQFKQQAK